MRTLRSQIVSTYSFIGIIAVFTVLLFLTGFLIGIVTPSGITTILALTMTKISASAVTYWLVALIGWFLAVWSTAFLMKQRFQPPIPISEDEIGAVEITPEALCGLARMELKSHGVPGPYRTEFTTKLGSPFLQVWCDLSGGKTGDKLVTLGMKLKAEIEKRLREDFSLKGIRVAIIHQPRSSGRRPSPKPAA